MTLRPSARLLALFLVSAPASAAVTGTVVTPEGVPIEGAVVTTAEAVDKTGETGETGDGERSRGGKGGLRVVTGRRGDFAFPDLAPPVLLLVTHPRFEDAVVEVPDGTDGSDGMGPLHVTLVPRQQVFDEIVVSATRDAGGGFQPVSVAATAVTPEEKAAPPSSVMDVIEGVPSVAENGQGGRFQTFSIRGLAGQRVLNMVSGARIVTERRAGVALSFVDPLLLSTVEVVRGPSSSYYGSGAVGGVVQVFPRRFDQLHFDVGAETSGDERWAAAGTGGERWSAAAAYREAGDAQTPDGETLFSRFEQYSGVFQGRWQTGGGTEWEVVAVPSAGRDIGKPNSQYPERVTLYPEENHLIFKVGARKPGSYRLDLWAHPNDLETRVTRQDRPNRIDRVKDEAFDFGANAQWELSLPWSLAGRAGLEYFGRDGVKATEDVLDASGQRLDRSITLDGSEDQVAAYGSVRRALGQVTVQAGTRISWIQQDNVGFDTLDDTAWSGFVGATAPLGGGLELAANVGTGLRFPTLSERFFTGTTGRGEVISNTGLDPERSVSGDLGLRFYGERVYATGYVFRNEIDDYIERIDVEPGVRTYVNLTAGTIQGFEIDGFVQATESFRIGWRGQWLDGESDDGANLSDIPADRFTVDATYDVGHWIVAASLQHRFEKDDPGSGEVRTPSAEILSASLAYQVRDGFSIRLSGSNLFDETYLPSADNRAVPAPERSIGVGLRWTD